MSKIKFSGLVVAGLLLGASVANAFPGNADEANTMLTPRSTYADQHRATLGAGAANAATLAFPGNADEDSTTLPPRTTRADQYVGQRIESMRAGADTSPFPVSNSRD